MPLVNGPLTIFKIILVSLSFIFNIIAFRCYPCNCSRQRCIIVPLFLAGNILTLILAIPDVLSGFDIYLPLERGKCSLTFVASQLLCTFFVSLIVLRRVLASAALQIYRRFFFFCLFFAPVLAAGIQTVYSKTAMEEPLMLSLSVPLPQGPQKEMRIPLASCAKNICGSGDVILTVLSHLLPALLPVVSLAVCVLVSYSARKQIREKRGVGECVASRPLIPEYCDREQNCWPVLKFVLILFFAWTIVAKPLTILLTHLSRTYSASGGTFGFNETTIYVCTNFWNIGNQIILFISSSLTPVVLVFSYRAFCRRHQEFSVDGKSVTWFDRPVTVMGSMEDLDIGTFSWDTFTFAPPHEKQLQLGGIDSMNKKSVV